MLSATQRLAARLRQKTAAPHPVQLQLGQVIPGTPLMIRGGEIKEERLPGMRRWVDRDVLQRVFAGLEGGAPPEVLVEAEAARGNVAYPAAGAAIAALSARDLAARVPQIAAHGPLASALVAALAGGVAGGAYHYGTRGKRQDDAREAIHGARQEIAKFPRPKDHAIPTGQTDQGTASASTPTLLATAPTNW